MQHNPLSVPRPQNSLCSPDQSSLCSPTTPLTRSFTFVLLRSHFSRGLEGVKTDTSFPSSSKTLEFSCLITCRRTDPTKASALSSCLAVLHLLSLQGGRAVPAERPLSLLLGVCLVSLQAGQDKWPFLHWQSLWPALT